MNPILESIANSVSATPALPSIVRPESAQLGAGAFASTLAAAQAAAARSQAGAGSNGIVSKTAAGSAAAPTRVNWAEPTPDNLSAKKRLQGTLNTTPYSTSNGILTASPSTAVVQSVVATQTSIAPGQIPSFQREPGLLQSSLQPVVTESVPAAVQTSLPTTGRDSTRNIAALSYSASGLSARQTSLNQMAPSQVVDNVNVPSQTSPNQTSPNQISSAQISSAQILLDQISSNQMSLNPTAITGINRNGAIQASLNPSGANDSSLAAATPKRTEENARTSISAWLGSPTETASSPGNAAMRNSGISDVDGSPLGRPELAFANEQQSMASAITLGKSAPNTPVPSTPMPGVAEASEANTPVSNAAGSTAGTSITASDQTNESPAESFLASASAVDAATGGNRFFGTKLQGSNADAATPDAAGKTDLPAKNDLTEEAVENNVPAQSSSGNLVESAGGQIGASSVPSSEPMGTLAKAMPQVSTPKTAVATTNPSAHGAGAGLKAPVASNSNTSSALTVAAGSDTGSLNNESKVAGQTPFSIFFSSPGPGSESAASVLPKSLLPVATSAIRGTHGTGNDAPIGNPQTGTLPSGIRQSPFLSNVKEAPSGTDTGTTQNLQTVRAGSDLGTAASVPVAPPQATAAPVTPAAMPAGVTVPAGGPPALPESAAPQTPSPTSSGSPATAVPVAPQPAVPGSVQVAQLVNRLGQSEMRIGLNTSSFGTVEVRTTVRTSDVGLVIGSEKGDLRTLLANDLPTIANTLQQQNLRLSSVNFMQGLGFSSNASGGGDSQQRSFVPTRGLADSSPSEAAADGSADIPPARGWSGGSISILA